MSKRPTGTSMDTDRLLELREARDALPEGTESALPEDETSPYVMELTDLAERADLPADAVVDWSVDERDDDPLLVFAPIPPDQTDDAAYPRRLREVDGERYVYVPEALLRVDPRGGLGLDLESYDDENPLLFETVGTDETIGLFPARFADGTPFDAEPLPETPSESDPVARETLARESDADAAPRPETVDAPIDSDVVTEVVDETDVSLAALADALEAIHRDDLLSIGDAVSGREPLSLDDRAVCLVSADAWGREVEPQLDAERSVIEAARSAHERQARRLVEAAGATAYRDALDDDEYGVAVTGERDTAEWEVSDAEDE